MKRRWIGISSVLGAALVLSSCGQPGAPVAPSLELPKVVDDLSASRKGDRVTLRWTAPNRFTDGRTIRQLGITNVCRTSGSTPATACEVVGKVPAPPPAPKEKQRQERTPVEYQDVLPQSLTQAAPTGVVMYGVEVFNKYGHSVGISGQVPVSTAPALAPPGDLAANVGKDGITLTWHPVSAPAISGLQFVYQISRRDQGSDFAPIAAVPTDQAQYLDQTFQWEKTSEYRVDVATESATDQKVLVEGDDTPVVSVFAHDIYPPAVPRELQAVFSGPGQQPFIDLSWQPDLEADLAGYNVYRREEGKTAVKLNQQLVTSPSYRDSNIAPGKTYFYSVSAVDARGNESARSAETSETVPQ